MAILYYNNAQADGDLGNILNWWSDAGFTVPATEVPGNGVDELDATVCANASANNDTGNGLCRAPHLVVSAGIFTASMEVGDTMTVASGAQLATGAVITCPSNFLSVTFEAGSTMNSGSLANYTNPVIFNGSSVAVGGSVAGSVIANGTSSSQITGLTIANNLTFAGTYTDSLPSMAGGSVGGSVFFTGTVTFTGVDNSVSPVWADSGTWNFTGRTNSGTINTSAAVVFTGAWSNTGDVTASVITCGGSGTNSGTFHGNASFTGTGTNAGGTVTGLLTVPGTQAGTKITSNLAFANLGTFGTLAISGISGGASDILGTGLL